MKLQFQSLVKFISILDQFISMNKMLKKQLNVLKKLVIFSKTFSINCILNSPSSILVKLDCNLFSQEISLKQENILINGLKLIKNMPLTIQQLISNTQWKDLVSSKKRTLKMQSYGMKSHWISWKILSILRNNNLSSTVLW